MKICIYSSKGGAGKTPIATNIILDREYAIGTNETFHVFDSFIPDDKVLALSNDEAFPEIPDDIDIVFDLAGSISAHSSSIVSAISQSDVVIVPIFDEVKSIVAGLGTIREVLRFNKNIIVVATKLEKAKKETFAQNEWHKSQQFLNIQNQVKSNFGDIRCLPLKFSKVFDVIFEKELSINQLMKENALAKYSYRDVALQFDEIYQVIDSIANKQISVAAAKKEGEYA